MIDHDCTGKTVRHRSWSLDLLLGSAVAVTAGPTSSSPVAVAPSARGKDGFFPSCGHGYDIFLHKKCGDQDYLCLKISNVSQVDTHTETDKAYFEDRTFRSVDSKDIFEGKFSRHLFVFTTTSICSHDHGLSQAWKSKAASWRHR